MKKKAQVILESALALVAIFILLVGIIKVWAWYINNYSGRWRSYNSTRLQAGQPTTSFVPDNYQKGNLTLFK